VIWKERNDKIFHGKENALIKLSEKIKLLSFWWFKANFVVSCISFTLGAKALFLVLDVDN